MRQKIRDFAMDQQTVSDPLVEHLLRSSASQWHITTALGCVLSAFRRRVRAKSQAPIIEEVFKRCLSWGELRLLPDGRARKLVKVAKIFDRFYVIPDDVPMLREYGEKNDLCTLEGRGRVAENVEMKPQLKLYRQYNQHHTPPPNMASNDRYR